MPVVTLAELLESGVHFGHQTRRWNPKMSQYIYTARNGVHIIDLVQTAELMEEAYDYVRKASDKASGFYSLEPRDKRRELLPLKP
ncbi:hypothetical protein CFPU101_03600 [Chroococcus sp. FPU101]|nr:hypothetical protein CFPU101_03600 [Chroococcus sp. FPU101]